MPIPPFDAYGLLPPGVHNCDLAEIAERFGRFRKSDRRQLLMHRLRTFVNEARATLKSGSIIVDGSFVTDIDEPNDIDLIIVSHVNWLGIRQVKPSYYNVLSKRRLAKRLGFDLVFAEVDSDDLRHALDFFQMVKGERDRLKGLLRIEL